MIGFYYGEFDAYGEYRATVGGYDFRLYHDPDNRDRVIYYAIDGGWTSQERRATFRPCAWARHLYGNPPRGTQYGSYLLRLPNGRLASCPVYV